VNDDTIRVYAINILWISSFLLPYLLFSINNKFKNKFIITVRAILAILGGWIYMIAYAIGADAINKITLINNNQSIIASDASFAFAFSLGWILPTVIILLSLLFHVVILKKIKARQE